MDHQSSSPRGENENKDEEEHIAAVIQDYSNSDIPGGNMDPDIPKSTGTEVAAMITDNDSSLDQHSSMIQPSEDTGSVTAVTTATGILQGQADTSQAQSVHSSSHCTSSTACSRERSSKRERGSVGSGEGSVRSGGGGRGMEIDGFDILRFRNLFLQTVEELRMRRESDVRKEKRIKELVAEKHQLQEKYDEVESSYSQHLEQCSRQEQEIKKQFNNQLRQIEEDKARQTTHEEIRHKEVKALKDEIRTLQLSKYNLEKKVEDQERQLQIQGSSREGVLKEMSSVESKYHTVLTQIASTSGQISLLEANVKEAIEMNRKLRYVNEHQKCLLKNRESEAELLRVELVEARVSLAEIVSERGEREQSVPPARKTAAQELKMTVELNKQLQGQLSGVREEHQKVLDQLREAHSLLDRHIETANTALDQEKKLSGELDQLREAKLELETELSRAKTQQTTLQQELSSGLETWQRKVVEVEKRLRSLQEDYTDLQESCDVLESEGNDRERDLKSEIESLEKKRVEEKEEKETLERELLKRVKILEISLKDTQQQQKQRTLLDKGVQVSLNAASPKTPLLPLATASPQAPPPPSQQSVSVTPDALRQGPSPTNITRDNMDSSRVPSPPSVSPEVITDSCSTSPALPDPVDLEEEGCDRVSEHVKTKPDPLQQSHRDDDSHLPVKKLKSVIQQEIDMMSKSATQLDNTSIRLQPLNSSLDKQNGSSEEKSNISNPISFSQPSVTTTGSNYSSDFDAEPLSSSQSTHHPRNKNIKRRNNTLSLNFDGFSPSFSRKSLKLAASATTGQEMTMEESISKQKSEMVSLTAQDLARTNEPEVFDEEPAVPLADQSVPHSPRGTGNNNFSIVFSEGEEERDDDRDEGGGGERDGLLSSQMNRQIKKVTSFLKMDRLPYNKSAKKSLVCICFAHA